MKCTFCRQEIVTNVEVCSTFVVVPEDNRGVSYAKINLCEDCVEKLQGILSNVRVHGHEMEKDVNICKESKESIARKVSYPY